MNTNTDTNANTLPNQTPPLQRFLPFYVLFLCVWIAYSGTYDNAFLYDDLYLIQKNTYLRDWTHIGDIFRHYLNAGTERSGHFYRPLQNILYLVIYQVAGPSTIAFHLLNITLHGLNACLVYWIAVRMRFGAIAAFLASLIWALHPIHTEAVTYMSGTADVLYSFFCLLGIAALLPDFSARRMMWASGIFIAGLLSKETSIIFPLLAMVCIFYQSDKPFSLHPYIKTWPLWLVAAGYMALRFTFLPLAQGDLLNIDPVSHAFADHVELRIYTFLSSIPSYAQLLIWPAGLHMDRDFPVPLDPWFTSVFVGLGMFIAAVIYTIWSRKKSHNALGWGLLWAGICYAPQTGILVPVNSVFLEHWLYLPAVGLFLGIAQITIQHVTHEKLRKILGASALLIAAVLGIATYEQNQIWKDPIVFYHNILDRGETSARARNNLGTAYMDRGEYALAMEQFRLALKQNDLTPETHQNIASLLSKNTDGREHIAEEISELDKALAINDKFLPALDGLASIYTYKGETQMADIYKQRAAAIRKGF